jgi:hypothetical protein
MGTVGPKQFVVVVNGWMRSWNKSTGAADGVLNMSTNTFFDSVRNFRPTSDPHIRYDRLSGRWIVSMLSIPALPSSTPVNRLLVAYSDGSGNGVITGGTIFTKTFIDSAVQEPSGCVWDYDTLGIDRNALYIGNNVFCGGTLGFLGTDGFVIPKAALFGGTLSATEFQTLRFNGSCPTDEGPLSPQGVDNYDPAATFGYFAGVSACNYGLLDFVRINNPGGSPSAAASTLSVPDTMIPTAVPALGSAHPLDALDDRLGGAHLRNGHLWTAHNVCVDTAGTAVANSCPAGSRDAARWYDITNLDAIPQLNQSGTVFDNAVTNPAFHWMPSIMVSGQGHAAMGMSVAGGAEHAEAEYTGRLSGDASGTMRAPTVYQTSTFAYNAQANPSSGRQRWGDYSFTSLDPDDDMTMWSIQEYANATDSWGVEAVQLKAPPPATPSSYSGTISAGQCNQTVTVTGTSTGGSGFFDPGPGFAKRLKASVTGGVTVNKVTYIDPTHLVLDISTTGASAGPVDLTVTNPDGQLVTASGFLTIQAATPLTDTESMVSTSQYTLQNSDGVTWVEMDPALRITCTPASDQSTLLTANADLFTSNAGFNQDIGIFYSDNGGLDKLLAWKESGGFAGTFSPNAAYVQGLFAMTAGHTYVFKLKWKTNRNAPGSTIYAAAGGPAPFSPTSLIAKTYPSGTVPNFVSSVSQSTLTNSDGVTWQPMNNAGFTTTLTPGSDSTAVLGANVDLFTGTAGYNQDIGIFVSKDGGAYPLQPIAWKESGGFAGTFSPNAAFVKAMYPMMGTHIYTFRLEWKTNKPSNGATIYAAAGPGPAPDSPTSLLAETISTAATHSSVSTNQDMQSNSDGKNWVEMLGTTLRVTVVPGAETNAILGANVDLFTGTAGYNQDIAIFVSVDGGADQLVAWKESGGFAGTFSPNAAFAQAPFHMTSGHTYVFKLMWKTNKSAPGVTIFAAAGPSSPPDSPTRVTVELTS